jgi:hypothetical protein
MEIILFVSELPTCTPSAASFKFVQVKHKIQAGSPYVCRSNRPINGFTVLLKGVYFCFGFVKSAGGPQPANSYVQRAGIPAAFLT